MKRFLFLVLFLTVLLGISSVWATTYNVPGDKATIQQAITDAASGDEIILQADFTILPTDYMYSGYYALMISNKTLVLDLNGNDISSAANATIYIPSTGTLTLKDTSIAGDGTIYNTSVDEWNAVGNYGHFNMLSGNLHATYFALYNYYSSATVFGTATISGGTLYGAFEGLGNCGDLTISGGSFSGSQYYDIDNSGKLTFTQDITLNSMWLRNGNDAPNVPGSGTLVLGAGVDVFGISPASNLYIETGATLDVPVGNNLGLANGDTTQEYELFWNSSLGLWMGPVTNIIQVLNYNSLQPAIAAAVTGDHITIAGGIYEEPNLDIYNKSLILEGLGTTENPTIVKRIATDTSGSYFWDVSGAPATDKTLTVKNLTIDVSGNTETEWFVAHISHLASSTWENVKLIGQGQSYLTTGSTYNNDYVVGGLDFINVASVSLTNVEVSQNGRNGISFTNASSITLNGINSHHNGHPNSTGWAGLAIYPLAGTPVATALTVSGTNTIDSVMNGIFVEPLVALTYSGSAIAITNVEMAPIALPNFDNYEPLAASITGSSSYYRVFTPINATPGLELTYLAAYYPDQTSAYQAAVAAQTQTTLKYAIKSMADGEFYVVLPLTIQGAINAATAGNTINVATGTYTEDVIIDKPLSILGANANIPYGTTRVPESKIQPATSGQTPVRLNPTGVGPDNVTINGFEITGPLSNYGIVSGDKGPSYLNIVYNYIHHIGTERTSGNVYAINYRCSELSKTDINFSHNYIDYVFNTTIATGFSAGIWMGQSTATGVYSNVVMEYNTIKNVQSRTGTAFGTDGANSSGINIGCGWKSTGYLANPVISNNNISDLTGSVVYGIALQGNTPGAIINNNSFNNFTDLNAAQKTAGLCVFHNFDAVTDYGTNNGTGISAHGNSFTNLAYGIANYMTNVVDGTQNWWGHASGPFDDDSVNPDPESDNPDGLGVKATGYVLYDPWYMDAAMTRLSGQNVHNIDTGEWFTTIQEAIDDGDTDAGDTIEVDSGTYVEQLHITTENLTIRGVGTDPVVIKAPDVLPLSFTTSVANKPVVFVEDVDAFTLKNVTVDGDNKGTANYRFSGVAFWNAGGTLEDVDVINIMDTNFSGAQHGVGVYANNNTPLENYTINLNRVLVDDFQKTGVALNGNEDSQNLSVNLDYVTTIGQGPTGTTAQNGIQVWDCTGTVDNCTVDGVYYTGPDWTASGMIVSNCVDMVLTGNIVTDSQVAIYSQTNTGVDYISNQISGDCDYGLYDYLSTDLTAHANVVTGLPYAIITSPGATITNNVLTGNDYAIWSSPGTTINNNTLTGNDYAIILDEGTGYTITGNQFTDNYIHVYSFGAEPDVNMLIPPTNTYTPTYFIMDQVIYGNGAILYVDADLEVIQDNVQQTYSVKASYVENLRGFSVKIIIPKDDFVTAPTEFTIGSAFANPPFPGYLAMVDLSTTEDWIYQVDGSVLGVGDVEGADVTFFTFKATSTIDYNNVPAGCYIQLPLADVTLRDELNDPIECFGTLDKWILIDNTATTPVVWEDEITALLHPCRTTPNANNSIDMMWTNPEGAEKIQIWTLSYGDAGTGFTHYPEYENHSEPELTAPDPLLGSPQNGWVKFAEIDPPTTWPYQLTGMERGYYYITLFAVDEAGNISAAPDAPFHRESISYWPGDVVIDGQVMDDDIGLLGGVWGFNSTNPLWNNVIDVGPSTDYARRSRPIPDNRINLEDLMMFAMNYYNTHYADYPRNYPDPNPVTVMMTTQNNGGQIVVNLELGGNTGFLKGLNMPIAYGSGLQLVSVEQGTIWPEASLLLHTNAEGLVEVSCVTLGQNALEGDGNVATLVFIVVGSDIELTLQPMIARSWDNQEIAVTYGTSANDDLVNVIPLESFLGSNFPNPFNPSTTIQYGLKEAGSVRINVYNSRGQLIRTLVDESKAAGTYRAVWDGKDSNNRSVSSGIYYFRMEAQSIVKTNKGLLIK